MNYEEMKRKLLFSKEVGNLERKISPIGNYLNARVLVDKVSGLSERIAMEQGLDAEYCGVLAISSYLGTVQYGKEGKIALDELLKDGFSQSKVNIELLDRILGKNYPEQLKTDLIALDEKEKNMSPEASAVRIAEETIEYYSLLTSEEKEKLGGKSLVVALRKELIKDENGNIQKGPNFKRLEKLVSNRVGKIDENRKSKAKEVFEKRFVDVALDDRSTMDKIIGE